MVTVDDIDEEDAAVAMVAAVVAVAAVAVTVVVAVVLVVCAAARSAEEVRPSLTVLLSRAEDEVLAVTNLKRVWWCVRGLWVSVGE